MYGGESTGLVYNSVDWFFLEIFASATIQKCGLKPRHSWICKKENVQMPPLGHCKHGECELE